MVKGESETVLLFLYQLPNFHLIHILSNQSFLKE